MLNRRRVGPPSRQRNFRLCVPVLVRFSPRTSPRGSTLVRGQAQGPAHLLVHYRQGREPRDGRGDEDEPYVQGLGLSCGASLTELRQHRQPLIVAALHSRALAIAWMNLVSRRGERPSRCEHGATTRHGDVGPTWVICTNRMLWIGFWFCDDSLSTQRWDGDML